MGRSIYVIRHRQHGGYLAKQPYACIDARYLYSRDGLPEGVETYSRYVDAFQDLKSSESIIEIERI